MKREELKQTEIYAHFASEVYDDFGDVSSEQEYYRKEHADSVMDAYEARIKELEAEVIGYKASHWIPVDVILPEWGKEVIVKMKDGSEEEVRFSHNHKWISQGMATCESSEVTHWKPKSQETVEDL